MSIRLNLKVFIFLFISTVYLRSVAMPAEVLLIRHGEKPPQGAELNQQGWQRAKALPNMFRNRDEFRKYGLPVALFAMRPDHDGGSIRAIQTLQYVSKDLGVSINTDFTRDQVSELVQKIKTDKSFDGQMIVICWEHKVLADIAKALGKSTPPPWPGSQFDRVWALDFNANGTLISFNNFPQRLLPGDNAN